MGILMEVIMHFHMAYGLGATNIDDFSTQC